MGWFKKKSDPITERAQALNEQIANLQQQIADLSGKLQDAPGEEPPAIEDVSSAPPPPQVGQPRLRSTALPRSQGVIIHGVNQPAPVPPPQPPPVSRLEPEPVFEEVPGNPFKGNGDTEPEPEPQPELGVRKNSFGEMWRRMQNHFKGPPAANPKLVSYLAAGSIQGLRPLRYEKRVARNRVIALVVVLVLILWGIIAVILGRK
jgi:hypothetical protein